MGRRFEPGECRYRSFLWIEPQFNYRDVRRGHHMAVIKGQPIAISPQCNRQCQSNQAKRTRPEYLPPRWLSTPRFYVENTPLRGASDNRQWTMDRHLVEQFLLLEWKKPYLSRFGTG